MDSFLFVDGFHLHNERLLPFDAESSREKLVGGGDDRFRE